MINNGLLQTINNRVNIINNGSLELISKRLLG